jgi:putative ABC transport system ATP-binding protein
MEGDDQVLKRKRNGETAAPSADGNGRPALLVAEGVRKVYRTGEIEVEALIDLDLTVGEGEMVAVMGPSGSGKTTLLNCLSGLDDIDGGRVLVAGRPRWGSSSRRST